MCVRYNRYIGTIRSESRFFFDIKNRIKRKETVLNLIKIYNKYKLEYDDLTYINPKDIGKQIIC